MTMRVSRLKTPLYGQAFNEVISLGFDCRPMYQIALNNYRRRVSKFSDLDFKKVYWKSGAAAFPSGKFFFDTVIAPFSAVIRCIEEDFSSAFDRESLSISQSGDVTSRDGIIYPHDFSKPDGRTTTEILDAEYPARREKFDHLKAKMITLFGSDRRVLYVVRAPELEDISEFVRVMHRKHPEHSFFVLSVVETDRPKGLVYEDQEKALFEIDDVVNKPAATRWEGEDAEWARVLDRVKLTVTENRRAGWLRRFSFRFQATG